MNLITRAMSYLFRAPLVDLDLPYEPSASAAALHLVDASPRPGSPGEDGPTASAPPSGAVGHPLSAELQAVRELVESSEDALREGLDLIKQCLIDADLEARRLLVNVGAALDLLDGIAPLTDGTVTDIRSKKGRPPRE